MGAIERTVGEVPQVKPYYVVSPEYSVKEVVLDDGSGPSYPVRDVVEVEANTKREAIIKGVAKMRAHPRSFGWLTDCDGNPFAGMKAELAVCEHGRGFATEQYRNAPPSGDPSVWTGCIDCEAQAAACWAFEVSIKDMSRWRPNVALNGAVS